VNRLPISAFALIALALGGAGLAAQQSGAPRIHYAPAENLERIDVALIDRAEHSIDMAAYVLTDCPVLQALTHAADRGVKVRIYLDAGELPKDEASPPFHELVATPDVEVRVKSDHDTLMHLKSYEVDGLILRTGSANFSASGEKRQDNDLIVIEDISAAIAFEHEFEVQFSTGIRRGEPK
jgi:phosphatidylserine/phosphatidylglycerophosphate/cardiolipin synthase-like enzyme